LLDTRTGDVLNTDFMPELEFCGCPHIGKRVGLIVFGSGDPFEVTSGDLGLQFEDEL